MFEDKAKMFAERINSGANRYEEKRFLSDLKSDILMFYKNSDKLDYLSVMLEKVQELKSEHEQNCPKETGKCMTTLNYQKSIFFISQEIEILVDDKLNGTFFESGQDGFNSEEVQDLNIKVDHVLNRLNDLGLGQEVIFDQIDELRNKVDKFSKKDFKLLLLGNIIAFGSKRLFSEKAIRDLFEIAGDNFDKLINN